MGNHKGELQDAGECVYLKEIYLDNAASTEMDPSVYSAMRDIYMKMYGNPSSPHSRGKAGKTILEKCRKNIANTMGAKAREIIFTSGGTESNNIAIGGIAERNVERLKDGGKGPHIVTSQVEHPSVHNTCKYLESRGFRVAYLPVNRCGQIKMETLEKIVTRDTFLISIIHGNNVVGTLQPLGDIGAFATELGILFHTDAIQSFGKVLIDVERDNIDLMSISGHKIHGPKGIGALYIRRAIKPTPLMHGGGQEDGVRPGTENLAGVVGLCRAAEIECRTLSEKSRKISLLRDKLINGILNKIDGAYLGGHPSDRLPGNAHFRFDGVNGEALVHELDREGIHASTGSACSQGHHGSARILTSMGVNKQGTREGVRFTLGKYNTSEQIEQLLGVLPRLIDKQRKFSPAWKKRMGKKSIEKKIE